MAKAPQTYANHARYVPMFHFVLGGLLVINFLHAAMLAWSHFSGDTLYALIVAISLMLLFLFARQFAVAVQDRVIRLELRLRLRELAPDVMTRFDQLTPAQTAALRFASDAELPDLARRTLEGKFTDGAAIKKQIKDWQGDYWRA